MMATAERELRAAAAHLRPTLADEVDRLYAIEAVHSRDALVLDDVRRRLHHASVVVGTLRQRLLRAELRLEQLDVEEISKARRIAYMLGDGYVRISHLGGGRFETTTVPGDQVVHRG